MSDQPIYYCQYCNKAYTDDAGAKSCPCIEDRDKEIKRGCLAYIPERAEAKRCAICNKYSHHWEMQYGIVICYGCQ